MEAEKEEFELVLLDGMYQEGGYYDGTGSQRSDV